MHLTLWSTGLEMGLAGRDYRGLGDPSRTERWPGLPESEYIRLPVDWHPAWAGWVRSGAGEKCSEALGEAEESCQLEMREDWEGPVS